MVTFHNDGSTSLLRIAKDIIINYLRYDGQKVTYKNADSHVFSLTIACTGKVSRHDAFYSIYDNFWYLVLHLFVCLMNKSNLM